MTLPTIDELRRLAEAATPAPWQGRYAIETHKGDGIAICDAGVFIVAARNARPGILQQAAAKSEQCLAERRENERLVADNARLRAALELAREDATVINRILSPGDHTFDELIRDAGRATDRARSTLSAIDAALGDHVAWREKAADRLSGMITDKLWREMTSGQQEFYKRCVDAALGVSPQGEGG